MNDDLTILPIKPEDNELKQTRELHPNLPNVYKGQLLALVGGVRMGKGTLWNNMLHNPNFYEGLFENVNIISPDTSYALIVDDSYNEFNKVGRKGGAVLRLASRFRHYVRKGDPCLYLYSTQKYLDLLPMIRANATGIIISGMIKNRKELDTLAYDLDDTFGGQFETIMEHARGEPYQWIYFRLDSTPPEAYLNFKDKVF